MVKVGDNVLILNKYGDHHPFLSFSVDFVEEESIGGDKVKLVGFCEGIDKDSFNKIGGLGSSLSVFTDVESVYKYIDMVIGFGSRDISEFYRRRFLVQLYDNNRFRIIRLHSIVADDFDPDRFCFEYLDDFTKKINITNKNNCKYQRLSDGIYFEDESRFSVNGNEFFFFSNLFALRKFIVDFASKKLNLEEKIEGWKNEAFTFEKDENGIPTHVFFEDGEKMDFNSDGKIIYRESCDGNRIWNEYDEEGYLIRVHVKNHDNYEAWTDFDRDQRETYHKNSNGFEVWREYDVDGNLHSKKELDENQVDADGNPVEPLEKYTEYDEMGNETYHEISNGYKCWWEYDEETGDLIHYRDTDGKDIHYEYKYEADEKHQIKTEKFADSSRTVTVSCEGEILSVEKYDRFGKNIGTNRFFDNGFKSFVISSLPQYDESGNISSVDNTVIDKSVHNDNVIYREVVSFESDGSYKGSCSVSRKDFDSFYEQCCQNDLYFGTDFFVSEMADGIDKTTVFSSKKFEDCKYFVKNEESGNIFVIDEDKGLIETSALKNASALAFDFANAEHKPLVRELFSYVKECLADEKLPEGFSLSDLNSFKYSFNEIQKEGSTLIFSENCKNLFEKYDYFVEEINGRYLVSNNSETFCRKKNEIMEKDRNLDMLCSNIDSLLDSVKKTRRKNTVKRSDGHSLLD